MKRIIASAISLAIIATNAIGLNTYSSYINVTAADTATDFKGRCGENATWLINSDGVLVISGKGEMSAYADSQSTDWGWKKYGNSINEIVVEDGINIAGLTISRIGAFDYNICNVFSKIIFPPSLTKLNGCLCANSTTYKFLKNIYIFSKNVTDASSMYDPMFTGVNSKYAWHGSGIIWHVYKDSDTEKSLRNDLKLTDEDIDYIPDDEQMPTINNKTPVELEPVAETSGPCGLTSKYEWDETNKTLTFSGKGAISIADYYKNYAEETEHIIIESGITSITSNTNICGITGDFAGIVYDPDYCSAFTGFTSLKDVQLPDTLQAVPNSAFYGTSLEEINFPDTLNIIGESAFGCCSKLKSINLHEGMTIGGGAFSGCESLKKVIIPKDILFEPVTFDGAGMERPPATFSNCTGLEAVVIENGCILTDAWNNPYTKNGLPDLFFLSCSHLKTIIIRGGVDYIGTSAFRLCPSLTDMYFYNTGLNTITAKSADDNKISIDCSNDPTFHVVKGSTTEQTLRDAGYLDNNNTEYLPDITTLETVIADAEKIDTTKYTNATLVNNLKTATENAKSVCDNLDATQEDVDAAVKALTDAISALTKPNTSVTPTSPTTKPSTTRSAEVVKKDKTTAENLMKQAKITKLKVKSKAKKKINVTWKKVKTAVGYQVQVSKKSNFKKRILNKFTTKKKLTINKKIKSGKTYFVRVRAYATYKDAFGKPQKVYSKWNKKLRKVKVK